MTVFDIDRTETTASVITTAVFSCTVTARAEHILIPGDLLDYLS